MHPRDLFIEDIRAPSEEMVYDPAYRAFVARDHPCRKDDCLSVFECFQIIKSEPGIHRDSEVTEIKGNLCIRKNTFARDDHFSPILYCNIYCLLNPVDIGSKSGNDNPPWCTREYVLESAHYFLFREREPPFFSVCAVRQEEEG